MALNTCMVLLDFREYGSAAPRIMDRYELDLIWSSAQEIHRDFSASAVEQLLADWEIGLTWTSIETQVDADWYTRAALVMALRGLRGDRKPTWIHIAD